MLLRRWSSSRAPIGFVGLGNMGGHMAANLRRNGHDVVVFDVNTSASRAFVEKHGGKAATSLQEVAQQTQCLVTMLPSNPHVEEVYLSDQGLLAHADQGVLFIDSSTIEPAVSEHVAKQVHAHGSTMIDAPVSGGVGGAEQGTLTFMVGGPEEALARATPLLHAMGSNIVHCGGHGTGQTAKLCNNLILAISMVGVSEGMNLGVKLGIDPAVLAKIVNMSTGRCWSSDTYNPCPGVMDGVPSSRNYEGGFGSMLMRKDLGLAISAANRTTTPLPLGSAAHSLYNIISQSDLASKDFSVVYEFLKGK